MQEREYGAFLKKSIEEIKEANDNNNLSIFAGAGVSIGSGLPRWSKLIGEFKKELYTDEKDFLKIAELYYMQFKDNIYYKKINNYFPKTTKPNKLHKKIVNINPKNLITTNWENLFELAIDDDGLFYDIIKSDDDIGFSSGISKLIKMHGSLDMRNIVFKESDYDNYSENFPLIENYIKGIFSTDLVLLVGYSLDDPNVKQIINWVNSKSKNIKPIYFLKIGHKFNYQEFQYYKNKNISILYYDESNSDSKKDKGELTLSFLDKILLKDIDIKRLSRDEFLEELYSILSPLKEYEYILPEAIVSIIKKRFSLYGTNEIFYGGYGQSAIFIHTKKIIYYLKLFNRVIDKLKKEDLEKVNLIKEVFSKAGILSINDFSSISHPAIISFKNRKRELYDYSYTFDFKSLKAGIDSSSYFNIGSNEMGYLKKAYFYYQLREYKKSYELLKEVSKSAFRNRKYDIYFISEFNRKQFYLLLKNEDANNNFKNEKLIDSYCVEINKIDLEEKLSIVPKRYLEVVKPLLNIESFINNKVFGFLDLYNKIDEDNKKLQKGIKSFNYNMGDLEIKFRDLYLFIHCNYLTIDLSGKINRTYNYVFKSIIFSKMKEKDYSIHYFLLYLGVKSFRYRELKTFLQETLQDELLEFEGDSFIAPLENLKKILLNRESNKLFSSFEEDFYTFITALSFIKVKKEQFIEVVKIFNELLEKWTMSIVSYDIYSEFIFKQAKKDIGTIDSLVLEGTLKAYMNKFLNGLSTLYDLEALNKSYLFINIMQILDEKEYKFRDRDIVQKFIGCIKEYHIENQLNIINNFLIVLFHILEEETQELIKDFVIGIDIEDEKYLDKIIILKYKMIKTKLIGKKESKIKQDIKKFLSKEKVEEGVDILDKVMNSDKSLKEFSSSFSEYFEEIKRIDKELFPKKKRT